MSILHPTLPADPRQNLIARVVVARQAAVALRCLLEEIETDARDFVFEGDVDDETWETLASAQETIEDALDEILPADVFLSPEPSTWSEEADTICTPE